MLSFLFTARSSPVVRVTLFLVVVLSVASWMGPVRVSGFALVRTTISRTPPCTMPFHSRCSSTTTKLQAPFRHTSVSSSSSCSKMTSGSNYDDALFPQTKQDKEDDAFVDTTTTTSSAADASVVASPLDRPLLAGLDLGALLLFASVGKASHSNAAGGIDVLAVLWVALPFVVSWFAVTPFLGLYDVAPTMNATASKRRAALMAVKGWVVAIPLGCVLRGVLKGYVPPLPFVVVTLLATLVLMVATRVLYATVQEQIRKEASS